MNKDEEKQRKNKIVGWTIGIIAIALYAFAVYSGAGRV